MNKHYITRVASNTYHGDVLALFRPLEETLSSNRSRVSIPINLFNRGGRRLDLALLEIIVESQSPTSEWKLKLEDVSITRLFKPTFSFELADKRLYLYKFIYDITSIMNTNEMISREWVNLNIKYEGGSPFTIKGLLLDAIYSDHDALSYYEHLTGFRPIDPGESITYDVGGDQSGEYALRVILYPLAKTTVDLQAGETKLSSNVAPGRLEEYNINVNGKVSLDLRAWNSSMKPSILLSSISLSKSIVKQPVLEIREFSAEKVDKTRRLKLTICNKGESRPDRVILTIIKGGATFQTTQDPGSDLHPGSCVDKYIDVADMDSYKEPKIRLVWFKLTKRWLKDYTFPVN